MFPQSKFKKNQEDNQDNKINPFEIVPLEMAGHIFNFFKAEELLKLKMVCAQWKTQIDTRSEIKAYITNKKIYSAVKNGNDELVQECLKNGADVNKKFNYTIQIDSQNFVMEQCGLLHIVINEAAAQLTSSFKHPFGRDVQPYINIFKLLIQYGIDTQYNPTCKSGNRTHAFATPESFLHELFQDNPLKNHSAALLQLRAAELDLEKLKPEEKNAERLAGFIKKIISIESAKEIVEKYITNICQENRGLHYSFSVDEKVLFLQNKTIKDFINNIVQTQSSFRSFTMSGR